MVTLFNSSKCSFSCSSDISPILGMTVFKVCLKAVTVTSLSSWPCTVKCTDILLVQLARTMVCLHRSHLTNTLAVACKSFLEQCMQRGYCWTFWTVFTKETTTVSSPSCGTSEGSSLVMPLSLSSWMAEMTEFGLVVNFFAPFQKRTRVFVILLTVAVVIKVRLSSHRLIGIFPVRMPANGVVHEGLSIRFEVLG